MSHTTTDQLIEVQGYATVVDLIDRQAAASPDRVAVRSEGAALTYEQLWDLAATGAAYLSARGAGSDDIVGVCVEQDELAIATLLAVLFAGAAYLPLDPLSPNARNGFMTEAAGARFVIASASTRSALPHAVDVIEADALFAASAARFRAEGVSPQSLAYVMFTSGSSGTPKGVAIEHRSIVNRLQWGQSVYPLREDDRVLQHAPLIFDFSAWEVFAPLAFGASAYVVPTHMRRDLGRVASIVAETETTVAHFVPSALRALADTGRLDACRSLRYLFVGGEPLDPPLRDRTREALPNTALINQYGPTETCIDSTWWLCNDDEPGTAVLIGRPIANTEVYLLDEFLEPVPIGAVGELHVGGEGLARGYVNRPGETADRFIPHPYATTLGARIYRTGDLARFRAGGALEYVGRFDNQVNVRGFRIELEEVDARVREHPHVADAATTVVGTGGAARLVSYVVPSGRLDHDALRRFLALKLPPHMMPQAFIELEDFPRLASGKINRGGLPAPAHASVPTILRERSPLAHRVAALWAKVLSIDDVDDRASFFDLGGHSLLAVVVIEHLRADFGLDVPIIDLFEAADFGEFVGRVEATAAAG